MLKIRLTPTGKKKQPSYRIVVAEHTAAVQGKFLELLGHYNKSMFPKAQLEVNKERITYWISKGAKPSDTVAVLLRSAGMENMDQYIAPRNLKPSPSRIRGTSTRRGGT
ncbi:MAG: 30S ribosomal protein S16 [Candidatus Peregrinibacteria bacterium GW2011_GWA2_44_7]|nr:MAG: 30S ribosomal protein S16 [Candidatus Peregrinibacteria bacterium GW2011_GWA2_44_7]